MPENIVFSRYEALQIEAVTSNRKNAAVDMKWADFDRIKIARVVLKMSSLGIVPGTSSGTSQGVGNADQSLSSYYRF